MVIKTRIVRYMALITLLTLATIALPVYALEPSEPHDANAMWIEPSTIDVGSQPVGYKFNVTVWANSSKQVKGWQIWLYYPKQYINATRCGYTAGTKSEFFQNITTMPVTPSFVDYNATHNRLDFGEAWIMGPYRDPGYGSLCWIEFEIIALPPEGQVVNIPLDIKYAFEAYEPPKTYLLYSDGTYEPLNPYNGLVIIPEFNLITLLLLACTTSTALYYYRKKC